MERRQPRFYCYSDRLHYFLMALRFRYVSSGINRNTNKAYWVFEKSEKLDDAILLYNMVKHKYN